MSSERPKRSRKIVNYGEDHLHWVEETQLQKALLRSLHEKDSPYKNHPKKDNNLKQDGKKSKVFDSVNLRPDSSNSTEKSNLSKFSYNSKGANFMPRSVVVVEPIIQQREDKADNFDSSKTSSVSEDQTDKFTNKKKRIKNETKKTPESPVKVIPEDSCELRLTRLQSKLLEEAGMFDPDDSIGGNFHQHATDETAGVSETPKINVKSPRKKLFAQHGQTDSLFTNDCSDSESNSLTGRVRAQRKFASNSSPPRTRSSSPVKMHKQKLASSDWKSRDYILAPKQEKVNSRSCMTGRAVRACSSEAEKSGSIVPDRQRRKRKGDDGPSRSSSKNPPASIFEGVPKADTFLTYLCFRRTSVKVELHDCRK